MHNELDDTVLLAWVPKSQYFYVNGAFEVACMDNFAWPTNKYINEEFSVLKPIFQKPEEITEPGIPINLPERKMMLDKIMKELDKNHVPFQYRYAPKEKIKQTFWSWLWK